MPLRINWLLRMGRRASGWKSNIPRVIKKKGKKRPPLVMIHYTGSDSFSFLFSCIISSPGLLLDRCRGSRGLRRGGIPFLPSPWWFLWRISGRHLGPLYRQLQVEVDSVVVVFISIDIYAVASGQSSAGAGQSSWWFIALLVSSGFLCKGTHIK